MVTYKNVHTDTLSIGRFKIKPGAEVAFDFFVQEEEAANIQYFGQKGYLVTLLEPTPDYVPEPEVVEEEQPPVKKRGKRNAHSE